MKGEDQDRKLAGSSDASHMQAQGLDGDILLPVQYYERVSGKRTTTGEFKLFFAILEDALRCFVRSKGCRSRTERMEFLEAQAWFNDFGPQHVLSFEAICVSLDIDAQCLRTRLKSLTEADFPRKQFRTHRRLPRDIAVRRGESIFAEVATGLGDEIVGDAGQASR